MTYRIGREVLADLLRRYNQVKRLHQSPQALHAWLGQTLSPRATTFLRLAVSLTMPRISLAWRAIMGQTIPPLPTCCHQECLWEEQLRVSVYNTFGCKHTISGHAWPFIWLCAAQGVAMVEQGWDVSLSATECLYAGCAHT
jgi:hypothetical protein